jgi:probable F420-dependent oxidoreductase
MRCSPPTPWAGREVVAMKIGLSLAQLGSFADRSSIEAMASGAEQRGYDSLWVIDRLLDPVAPRSQYPGSPDGSLPPEQRVALDPLVALAAAAAITTDVRLGTSVLVAPWYRPVLLARSLASLDVISRGRLDVGLGLGWSADEYAAAGVPQRELAARQEELLDVLEAVWSDDVAEITTRHVDLAPSRIRPAPVQRPRPPILLAAYTPAGLERAGRRADGWTPAGLSIDATAAMWSVVTSAAVDAGRDPAELSLVVRANVHHTSRPLADDRPTFHGSVDQIAEDLRAASDIGAHEVVVDLQGTTGSVSEHLDLADAIVAAGELRSAA